MADQVLSRTLNQKFDTVFEEVTHQETLNLLNRNDLKLFCLDIETNQFNYDPLVEFLEAPKILSKYEQVTAGGTYKAQSEGVHLLSVGNAGAPAYQLVYGASGIIDDIQDAIDKAFEEIAAVSNGQRKERQVVDSTVMGRSFDEDTTA